MPDLPGGLTIMVVIFVIAYLFAASSFTAATFSHFTHVDGLSLQIATLCIPAVYVAATFLSFRRHNPILRLAAIASSVGMGFLNFASLAALLCWPTYWLLSLTDVPVDRALIAWGLYACSALIGVLALVNALTLRVTSYEIALPNLPPLWHGRRVALVSDVHVGNIFGPTFVRRIVQQLRELDPAAVFLCGDMFDGVVVNIPKATEPWANFHAPAGTYFVSGNHEEMGDRTRYLAELSKAGVTVLNNQLVLVDGLQIVGVHDPEAHRRTTFETVLRRANVDRRQPSILMAHRPGRLDVAEEAGISLQLSGHTHAGQFPPFSVLVRKIYGRFGYGHNRHGSLQVVTSSGAGTGGPPFRFGTRSEIVLLHLRAEAADSAMQLIVSDESGRVRVEGLFVSAVRSTDRRSS